MLNCTESQGRISLEGELVVHELAGLRPVLDRLSAQIDELTVDLGGIAQVDTAGLQILVSFVAHRAELGPVRLVQAPPLLLRAAGLTGLETHLAPFMG